MKSTATLAHLIPELLAPAGDWECARAAVENGADAIYFGVERFNARMRARNFTLADLPELIGFLHERGVKGYVTFNTLVFTDELRLAEETLRAIIRAGVDAAIVQDVGICRLIRQLSPDFPIHASTQMTVTSPAGVEFARSLGCQLVVLARECSLAQIESIQNNRSASGSMPLEVFVHGALCVAYSGQCLTSESLGGRSANRGECAQACRMPYELLSDGKTIPLGNRQYLLSPQDLSGLEVIPELARLKVASLKIEGRLKAPEYVANITRVYRKALDLMRASAPDVSTSQVEALAREKRYDLEMSFSRGLYPGWFRGINNQELVHGQFAKKRGVLLGSIAESGRNYVSLRSQVPIREGDGLLMEGAGQKEIGGRVIRVEKRGELSRLYFHQTVPVAQASAGSPVWKTSDPQLEKELRRSFTGEKLGQRRPIEMEVHGRAGQPLSLNVSDEQGNVTRVESSVPLVEARTAPLDDALLQAQFSRLGDSPFTLGKIINRLEGQVILPVGELNRLRREATQNLVTLRRRPSRWNLKEGSQVDRFLHDLEVTKKATAPSDARSELTILVRTWEQLETVIDSGCRTIYVELEDPKRLREAVALCRQSGFNGVEKSVWLAGPRIFKTGEEWILKMIRSSEPDGFLIRNYDQLSAFSDSRRIGDFSLNLANPLSVALFQELGLERCTASYDLNASQLESLLQKVPGPWMEVTIHQHMPMFHMEHCVFCAFLSKGRDYRDCGRPCDRHEVRLKDRVGAEHLLKADAGCRNTVFNSRAQTGAEFVSRFQKWGIRFFRIEFLDETAPTVRRTLDLYGRLLSGNLNGSDLWRELKIINQIGVTRGQLEGA